MVAPFAVSELISTYSDMPSTYFLLDIGAGSMTLSLIDNHQLFATRSFSWGGDNITNSIVSSFNISEKEAESIKCLYGLDKREMRFDYVVAKSMSPAGELSYTIKQLNEIIEKELQTFKNMLDVGIEQLSNAYNIDEPSSIPLVIIGGGSKLKGFKQFLYNNIRSTNLRFLKNRSIGARDSSLTALLGALLVENRYPVNKVETPAHVTVSRDE